MKFASKSTVNVILLTKKLLHRHNLGNNFSKYVQIVAVETPSAI